MCSFQKYRKRSGFYSSEFCRCLHFLADPVCGCDPQIFLRGNEWRICGDRELQDDICKQSVSSGRRQHTSVLRSVCAAAGGIVSDHSSPACRAEKISSPIMVLIIWIWQIFHKLFEGRALWTQFLYGRLRL